MVFGTAGVWTIVDAEMLIKMWSDLSTGPMRSNASALSRPSKPEPGLEPSTKTLFRQGILRRIFYIKYELIWTRAMVTRPNL